MLMQAVIIININKILLNKPKVNTFIILLKKYYNLLFLFL